MTRPTASIEVRPAHRNDAAAIAHLAGELGYPSTVEQVAERLDAIKGVSEHAAFVAVVGGGQVVGWIHLSVVRTLETDPSGEIDGLVVDSLHRGAGIGRLLIEHGEAWARQNGLASVGLRSNVMRERAHAFYLRQGYTVTKSQKVFRKQL